MTDERLQTGAAMTVIGTLWTFAANNPTEFVAMLVSVGGFVIMLVKYIEERKQRNELHELVMQQKRIELERQRQSKD